jgi:hypothetical protein
MNEIQRQQVALFRFGVLGPLVSGELAHGELKRKITELSSRRYTIPFSEKTTIGFGTIEEWLHNFRKDGMGGLMPSVRCDKGAVRGVRSELKEAIVAMKSQHPKRSLRAMLNNPVATRRMRPNEISKTTAYRLLGQALPQRPATVTGKQQKRFVHRFPNQCWQGDVMHGPYIKSSPGTKAKKTYLIAFIDDASRLIVGAEFFFSENTDYLATVLVGQPPLKKTITRNKFLPLRQRISVTYHLNALSREDSYHYVKHHLDLVKAPRKVFMDNALETIISAAKGIPRMINTIALKAMYLAAERKMTVVDQECVIAVPGELGLK